ncbi:MAG: hypothetical protein AB7U82_01940 [Blastocatellales bacterium]
MKVNNEPKALTATDDIREVTGLTPELMEEALSILDDLSLSSENESDIKAGCLGCGWGPPLTNHNETTVEDDEAEVEPLDDLMLSETQGNDIKAGCIGCNWGPPLTNHNETAVEDEESEPEAIADLPMEDDEQVKAGGAGGGGGAGKVVFQDMHFTTKVA